MPSIAVFGEFPPSPLLFFGLGFGSLLAGLEPGLQASLNREYELDRLLYVYRLVLSRVF
jgi:hypothetical protein